MAVTKKQADELGRKLEKAALEILAEAGFEGGRVSVHFGDRFDFKISASPVEKGKNGVNTQSEYAVSLARAASLFDLEGVEVGTAFFASGKTYYFAGLALSRSKYPIAALDPTTGVVFFTEQVVPTIRQAAGLSAKVAS